MITVRSTCVSLRRVARAAVCAFCVVAAVATAHAGPRAYALAGQTLVPLDLDHPQSAGSPIPIAGLAAGDTLVGIDFRPMNGHLYGLAIAEGVVRLYHLSFRTGTATAIGPSGEFVATDGVTPAPVRGTSFGVDFDPVLDRLRVVTNARENFLVDPNTGALVDGDAAAPGVNMDRATEGEPVDAAAYTNSRQSDTQATLYTLSPSNDTLYVRSAAATAPFAYAIPVLAGGARLDFTSGHGFDILPGVNVTTSGQIAVGRGYALLTPAAGGGTGLYAIDLTTGVTERIGSLGDGTVASVHGLAVQGEEVLGALPAVAITRGFGFLPASVFRFTTDGTGSPIGLVGISGLPAGEEVVGVDWRPQTGQLVAITQRPQTPERLDDFLLLVRPLDPLTGVASQFEAGILVPGEQPVPLGAGVDFDPTTNRLRVVTENGQYATFEPETWDITEGTFTGLPAGSTGLGAAAYTNSFGQTTDGSGPTTLYTLDPVSNRLFIESPGNPGVQTGGIPVIRLRFPIEEPFDFSAVGGFDIPASVRVTTPGAPATGRAYAILTPAGETGGRLFTLDLGLGLAVPVRDAPLISLGGQGVPVVGLALGDGPPSLTALTLSSSPGEPVVDQPVTLTAKVLPLAATGVVQFSMNGAAIEGCEARPLAEGTATCATRLAAGTTAMVAVYRGDDFHLPATGMLTKQVAPLPPAPPVPLLATTTTLMAAVGVSVTGQTATFTAAVAPAAATGTMTFFVDDAAVGTVSVASGAATFSTSGVPAGTHQVSASYSGDATFAGSASAPSLLTIDAPGPLTQYFAEGAGGFFRTQIGILNASGSSPANVTVSLFPEGGAPVELLMTLAPFGRQTLDLDSVVDHAAGVSALISSDQPVAATRLMTWGDPIYGATLESGIPSTSPTWYFAEGATGAFSLYYLLQNPGATEATVTLTHLLEGGDEPVVHQVNVPPFARHTVLVNDVPGLAQTAMSTAISADVPIVAERAMYLSPLASADTDTGGGASAHGAANGGARFWEGGASGRGATAPSDRWSFAEGATGFFHTYLLLGNPGTEAAPVTVRYQLPDGTTVVRTYDVAARSRRTIDVSGEDEQLAATAVGMQVTATRPIVAERAMWWGVPVWNEGSAALGSTETGYVWAIGEGAEAGPADDSTFVLVTNASATAGSVRFTVCYDDGTRQEKEYGLGSEARLTVRIGDDFTNSRGHRFSVVVESLTESMPIGVDVSRYQSVDGFLSAGGAAPATRIVR